MSVSASLTLSSATFTPPSKASTAGSSLSTKPGETAAQQFEDFANMTPAQRMQAEMLNQLGITEDQFKAMSPADQQKVMDKVREMIKQQTQNSSVPRTGVITDMSV